MKKVSRIWLWLFLVFVGYSGGILTGVAVDVDVVYETTIKKLKQKRSPGSTMDVTVDVPPPEKSKKEIRKEERDKRKAARKEKRNEKKRSV
jgi:hypothetical protein